MPSLRPHHVLPARQFCCYCGWWPQRLPVQGAPNPSLERHVPAVARLEGLDQGQAHLQLGQSG